MTTLVPAAPVKATAAPRPLLQRKCVCGGSSRAGGECEECRKKKLQRRASGGGPNEAPSIVHEILRSPGKRLDAETRGLMEHHFGQDFQHVRIHTDAESARSAQAVEARAYTVGNHVVFNQGKYQPSTTEGRGLLAHELTHVVQQSAAPATVQRSSMSVEADSRLLYLADQIDRRRSEAAQKVGGGESTDLNPALSAAPEISQRLREAARSSTAAEREAILRAFSSVMPEAAVQLGKFASSGATAVGQIAKCSLTVADGSDPAEREADQNAHAVMTGNTPLVASSVPAQVQRFADGGALVAAGTAILVADAEAAPLEAAAGPPGWVVAGVGVVAGLALIGIGTAVVYYASSDPADAQPAPPETKPTTDPNP